MDKDYVDELYHQLRLLYLQGTAQEKEAVQGIVSHLTQPNRSQGDYNGLLRFLSWYGESFLLNRVYDAMTACKLKCERIVELGCGFAWLGRGLARLAGGLPTLFVDKRQFTFVDVVADIETKNGTRRVLDEMKPNDLIVMSELLHCLDNPRKTLEPFLRWPVVAVEYLPAIHKYRESYDAQISEFGCTPIPDAGDVFGSVKHRLFGFFPHVIVVAEPL